VHIIIEVINGPLFKSVMVRRRKCIVVILEGGFVTTLVEYMLRDY
jgi:hypothetical protein